jgi:sugar lactone lactonase YvrE
MLLGSWLALAAAVVAAPLGAAGRFPEVIPLPNGFQPEGIAVGKGGTFYVGSIPTGAIYRGSVKTGEGEVINPGGSGRAAIGVELDHRTLYVAGGPTGKGFVYSALSGRLLATHTLTTDANTFVNDVAVARGGAYFTDSLRPFLYRVDELGGVAEIPLGGDIEYVPGFNLNGIDATPDGKTLLAVQSNVGKVFTIDPRTGRADEIELDTTVVNGDGILLDGRTLYVVQNRDNKVAVIRLDARLRSGRVVAHLTDPDFAVPTTIDELGSRLYAVNARFGTPPTPQTPYWVAKLRKYLGD